MLIHTLLLCYNVNFASVLLSHSVAVYYVMLHYYNSSANYIFTLKECGVSYKPAIFIIMLILLQSCYCAPEAQCYYLFHVMLHYYNANNIHYYNANFALLCGSIIVC